MSRVPPTAPRRQSPDSDEAIVEEVLGGAKERFQLLIERHEERVYKLVRRFVGDDEAADVAQDSFLRAYLHLDQYDPTYSFVNWMLKIAQNRAFSHLRRKGVARDRLSLDAEGTEEPTTAADDPLVSAEARDTTEKLERAMMRVPEKYRILLHLRHAEGRQGPDIARILGIPHGTVKYRFHEAYRMLRGILVELGVVER
jgi:RNA polymerase sigma-70 factor (ECF subfamily)